MSSSPSGFKCSGEENTIFSLEGPYTCCFQADYPQITLMDLHHQPGPDSFTLTSWFAILAAEHKTCAHCTRGVMLSQQLSSKGTCAPNSQFPAMGAHIPRNHVSWVSRSTLEASDHTDADETFSIDSGACSFKIFMSTGQLVRFHFKDLALSPETCPCKLKN